MKNTNTAFKKIKMLSVVMSFAFSISPVAQAEIPSEFVRNGVVTHQRVLDQYNDGVVYVRSAAQLHTLYSDAQLVELIVENLSYEKTIYIYDRAASMEYERSVKVRFVNPNEHRSWLNHGEAVYLGKTEDGQDRFLIALVSAFRAKDKLPIEIYVQMAGQQFQTFNIQVALDQ